MRRETKQSDIMFIKEKRAAGWSYCKIARAREMNENTVKYYVKKLGLSESNGKAGRRPIVYILSLRDNGNFVAKGTVKEIAPVIGKSEKYTRYILSNSVYGGCGKYVAEIVGEFD